MKNLLSTRIAMGLLATVIAGCDAGTTTPAPTPSVSKAATGAPTTTPVSAAATAAVDAAARNIYSTRCIVCHGPEGAGDGSGAAALVPKPRNLGEAAWQDSISDEQIEKVILDGGAAVGKAPIMPGNPDLKSKPEVLAALRRLVRSLRK